MPSETDKMKPVQVGVEGSDFTGPTHVIPKDTKPGHWRHRLYVVSAVFILLLNYFLAQYDKFVLSYFQDSFTSSLGLSATQYGVLSGFSTGIVYALLSLPIAYLSDYFPSARVWVLTIASLWWSLCVIFQGLSHNFWQVFLARIGMGIGQAAVEPLSVSLISDLILDWRNVFLGESLFYVGVYIGEAISGQIATAFTNTGQGWAIAMRAIGIAGLVLAVFMRLLIREPDRKPSILQYAGDATETPYGGGIGRWNQSDNPAAESTGRFAFAREELLETLSHVVHMRSFWLLVLSASFRQLAGNVFGFYMPSYLENTYPSHPEILSRYGIIVGVVGTVAVLGGGAATTLLWDRTRLTPIYLTSVGGMISSIFVLLMIFSKDIAGGDEQRGIHILYGSMSAAYITAETWLGALAALIAMLLPPRFKTFGLAIWSTVQVLVYSSGPEIIGLALRNADPDSPEYTRQTQIALAVIIPIGYWLAGLGFLLSIPNLTKDVNGNLTPAPVPKRRKFYFLAFVGILVALVIALFVASIVYQGGQ